MLFENLVSKVRRYVKRFFKYRPNGRSEICAHFLNGTLSWPLTLTDMEKYSITLSFEYMYISFAVEICFLSTYSAQI